ncbi:MAG: DUF4416 family protein [Bacteriovorax sp.]|jgi:hypothetical protein
MSDLNLPSPGLIFGSALFNSKDMDTQTIKKIWSDRFGPSLEFHHEFFPMKEYYSRQMGDVDLLKRVIFMSLAPEERDNIVAHKIWADKLEKEISGQQSYRALNLDIGLLTVENVSLATGKNFAHRIYLGQGVFSDLNLQIEHKIFVALPWTYPDYAHPDFIHFFSWVRGFLLRKNNIENT